MLASWTVLPHSTELCENFPLDHLKPLTRVDISFSKLLAKRKHSTIFAATQLDIYHDTLLQLCSAAVRHPLNVSFYPR